MHPNANITSTVLSSLELHQMPQSSLPQPRALGQVSVRATADGPPWHAMHGAHPPQALSAGGGLHAVQEAVGAEPLVFCAVGGGCPLLWRVCMGTKWCSTHQHGTRRHDNLFETVTVKSH